jgi:starch synthase (maltosyl-transferring)
VNQARRAHPALQQLERLRFLDIDNAEMIAYAKTSSGSDDAVIVVVNLDPFAARDATVRVPHDAIGLSPGEPYDVEDLLTGARYAWSEWNYVHLDPINAEPAHLLRVIPRS